MKPLTVWRATHTAIQSVDYLFISLPFTEKEKERERQACSEPLLQTAVQLPLLHPYKLFGSLSRLRSLKARINLPSWSRSKSILHRLRFYFTYTYTAYKHSIASHVPSRSLRTLWLTCVSKASPTEPYLTGWLFISSALANLTDERGVVRLFIALSHLPALLLPQTFLQHRSTQPTQIHLEGLTQRFRLATIYGTH